MSGSAIVVVVLALAAALGALRTARARTRRKPLRIVLQFVASVLVYFLLFPPSSDERFDSATLVVLTPEARTNSASDLSLGSSTVALPGASAPSGVERAPDLGTALRRHPETERIHVVGGGLPARDRDAARGLRVDFDAPPSALGVVELASPSHVRAGSVWNVSGRVEGGNGGRIELRDPAGAVVGNATLTDDGRFALSGEARHAGNALFALRVVDASGKVQEDLPLPIVAEDTKGMRVLLLAGAPDPDLKYLRRWAVDAGVQLTSRMAVSDGIAVRDGAATLTAQTLAETDVVIVDERAWKTLDASAKSLLADALRDGLGIMLRVGGAMPDDVAAQWQDFGFAIKAADIAQNVSLEHTGADQGTPPLTRRALTVEGADTAPLLRASDGSPVALWRAEGQGRVAVWWLGDTFRLSLAGDAGRFGTLWCAALRSIARARASAQPRIPEDMRVNERNVFCNLAADAFVEQPDAKRLAVSVEETGKNRGCAAFWPSQPGWHALVSGNERSAFRVRAADEGNALATARTAAETLLLAGRGGGETGISLRPVPMPRWPLFLATLMVLALLWWLERGSARVVDATTDAA
ncbi:MAG: hypothetical protein ACREPX_10600 [Rhodanobacteraceae bacterium]